MTARGIAHRASLATVVVVAAACAEQDEVILPPARAGVLEPRWTIDGAADASRCDAYGAARMRLVVFDAAGTIAATEVVPCAEFEASLTLPVDTYAATATLVTARGAPVSRTLPLGSFEVVAERTTRLGIAFTSGEMRL